SLETLKTVTIGDIAQVNLGAPLRLGASLVDGKEAIVGTALLLSGENSRAVSIAVDKKIDEIKKILPAGIHITTLLSRSDLVNATLRTVLHNLLIGAALVVVVLLLLVGNLRAALITASIIPLALLFTFICMHWRGITGNLMSLGALDFGVIIDAAVIVMENCVRRLHEKTKLWGRSPSAKEVKETVIEATIEMRKASGFGQLIILAVFLPIFALTGIEGKMFKPMAAAFSFALIGALIFSFTTAPALASLLLKGTVEDQEPWLMRKLKRAYEPTLKWAIVRPYKMLGFALLSILAGILLFSGLGAEFLPQLNEGSIVVIFHRDVNIGLDAALSLESQSDQLIASFPEVGQVFSRIGTAEMATDPMGVNSSDTFVMLKEQKEWPKVDGHRRTKQELIESIAKTLREKLPEQGFIMSQPIQERFNEILEGLRADISVKIFDDDLNRLLKVSEESEELLQKVPGAGQVEAEMSDTSPVLRIVPKNDLLARFGIGNDAVLEAVSTALGGKEVGFLFEGVRRFPIMIRLNEADRSNLETIKKIPVKVGPNLTLPLEELADISMTQGFATILHENNKRRAAILMDEPQGRDTLSFVKEAQETLKSKIKLPEGSTFEWGGNFKNLEQAKERLLFLTPIVLILVFLMIYAVFRDVLQTCLIFSGIPLALVGGVLALKLNGLTFSISAGIGFIALSGIAILNGVVLISYFNQLEEEGLSGHELVLKGSLLRLRPVLMTALVDIFGFLPMMLSHGVGAEVQKPLATVVIGGIISSTILTLVILPAAYGRMMQRRKHD
ncbi:MAG: efflux RND transporter permease subunit, partial [Deltaproteobacteria bacterium]|nr:efflux RND transporter permease subunit [Deltaproteobacteria bacterium]